MNDARETKGTGRVSKSTDRAGLIASYEAMHAAAAARLSATQLRSPGMTPEERRLEDLRQMAAYAGPVVSFDVRDPYYLCSCDHCGWVGSSELCGTSDADDVHCPRCHSPGADCGKVATAFPTPPNAPGAPVQATDRRRDAVRQAIYDGLRYVGTLPEPDGDVPALYQGWDDLGDLADRIIATDAPETPAGEMAGRRDTIRQSLYDGLREVGTLPEPGGDVPMRYHRWADLGGLADRIVAATPRPAEASDTAMQEMS